MEDAYLGDGVYASWDGYHVVLDLRGQDDYTKVALDPSVRASLRKYMDKFDKPQEEADDG